MALTKIFVTRNPRLLFEEPEQTLIAPGVTPAIKCDFAEEQAFQYTINTIETSVTVRPEGSLDGVKFFRLDANEADQTKTAADVAEIATYVSRYVGKLHSIRFRFVSESPSPSTATIDIIMQFGTNH